ncbi:unnamed protein product [Cunninghamella blakesleeana]
MHLITFSLSIILSPLLINAFVIPTRLLSLDSLVFHKTPTGTSKTNFKTIKPNFKKASSSSTSAPLYNAHSFLYLAEIGIGSEEQKFTVAIDTGSADLWVPSNKCTEDDCGVEKYNANEKDLNKYLNETFEVTYGSGDILGKYYKDIVTIGNFKVKNQQFGVVDEITGFRLQGGTDDPNFNGLLGLGFPGLTASKEKSYNNLVLSMYEQKLIEKPMFSVFLNSREKHDAFSGEIRFGSIDSSKYQGNGLKYVPLVPTIDGGYAHWAFRVQQIKLNDKVYKINAKDSFIFDTGSSLSYIPTDIFESMLKQLKKKGKEIYVDENTGVYAADCDYARDPSNQIQFTLPSKQQPITITIPFADTLLTDDPNLAHLDVCTFGFQPMSAGAAKDSLYSGSIYVLGDSVLRSLYLTFHFDDKTIGVASANNFHGNAATVV